MPAKSKAMQQAAGADLSRLRRGEKPRTFKKIDHAELEKIASTSHKGLPRRVKKK